MWNPFSRKSGSSAIAPVEDTPQEVPDLTPAKPSGPKYKIAEIEHIGETAVATFSVTELSQEKGVELLTELLSDLIESGSTHFVLDIQNVQFMDSACLGCLVEALNKMAVSGGRIALANTAHSVQYLFRLTQLDRVFPICSDVMAAIAAVERHHEAA